MAQELVVGGEPFYPGLEFLDRIPQPFPKPLEGFRAIDRMRSPVYGKPDDHALRHGQTLEENLAAVLRPIHAVLNA